MIRRWWRAQVVRVESMADPAQTQWDRPAPAPPSAESMTVDCDRCDRPNSEWVAVYQVHECYRDGDIVELGSDVVATVCVFCAETVDERVRAAVEQAVTSGG